MVRKEQCADYEDPWFYQWQPFRVIMILQYPHQRRAKLSKGMGVWDKVKGAYEMTLENVRQDVSFFDRPGIEKGMINIANGIPFAIERVTNSSVGIGGVYGTWGHSYLSLIHI